MNYFFKFFIKKRNPVFYWREMGAKIGNNCSFLPGVDLGTEPFLIKIGNNVRLNSNVRIVTHDGGGGFLEICLMMII